MAGPCSAETEEQVRGDGGGGEARRREDLPRRRLQAAQLAVQLPGPRRRGAAAAAGGRRRHNLKLVTEVMDISQIELIEQYARHPPGRRAQHAELHAAARARAHAQAGAAEARHLGDDRGVAALGRVHPRAAATPTSCSASAASARSRRYTRNTLDISAIPVVKKLSHLPVIVGSEPRRPAAATRSRRWRARRSPPAPTGCIIEVHCDPDHALQRRRAVDVPGAVRSPDGGAPDHRAGDRPQHLCRAGGEERLESIGDFTLVNS